MKLVDITFYIFILCMLISCNAPKEEPQEIVSTVTLQQPKAPVFHESHEPKKQNVPFSDAVQVGNTFYLSGQIGMDHATRELVPGGIVAETEQTLKNIKAVLKHHSLEMQDVVKATVILDTIADFSAFNEVYVQYFPQKPARTTFAAEALAMGAKIEIEVMAVAKGQ
ncbi:MAG: reactive intermediate/imine deaminase [Flavobacteriaceae bacterium]|nr:reactive intermediate/imine deaminase [Flavobacteriaceae bacterium]|tara:strand:- start:281 stop:781 length:501 start_codon:yes stop_codon:yes gene_type:complete